MKRSVCLNCKERYIGCHSVCNKYIEESKLLEEEKQKRRKAIAGDVEIAKMIKDRQAKTYNLWRRKHGK